MATKAPPRKALGQRPSTNWLAARAYFLALEPERRTFKAVADRFRISEARVGQVAKRDDWVKAAEEMDERTIAAVDREQMRVVRRIVRDRATRISRTLELFDRVSDLAMAKLPLNDAGEIDLAAIAKDTPALEKLLTAMPGLHRMAELAAGEATDRVHVSEVQPVLLAFARIALLDRGEERERILGMLTAASSGLVEIEGRAERVA